MLLVLKKLTKMAARASKDRSCAQCQNSWLECCSRALGIVWFHSSCGRNLWRWVTWRDSELQKRRQIGWRGGGRLGRIGLGFSCDKFSFKLPTNKILKFHKKKMNKSWYYFLYTLFLKNKQRYLLKYFQISSHSIKFYPHLLFKFVYAYLHYFFISPLHVVLAI